MIKNEEKIYLVKKGRIVGQSALGCWLQITPMTAHFISWIDYDTIKARLNK